MKNAHSANEMAHYRTFTRSTPPERVVEMIDWAEATEKQIAAKCFQIMELLDGIPIGVARYLLKEASGWIDTCHVVDSKGPIASEKRAECEAFPSESSG